MSLRTFGVAAFREAVDGSLDLARLAQRIIEEDPRLELMTPATLGVVCFRRRFEGVASEAELGRLNAAVAAQLEARGVGLVSSTRLHGRCTADLRAQSHQRRTRCPIRVGAPRVRRAVRRVDVVGSAAVWCRPSARVRDGIRPVDGESMWRIPLLAGLSADGRRIVLRSGHEIRVAAGVFVVRRWAADRDFYLVLDGRLVVDVDGVVLRRLGEHDFFGELAARDWGSGSRTPGRRP